MVPYDEPIYDFSSEQVSTRGYIDLHTVFREGTQTKTIPIRFLIVDAPTSYNVLLGRPSLNTLGAVVSTPYLAMKFPSPSGDILTIHCDQRLARECYMASLRPQLPIQQTNHIERPPGSDIALSGEYLYPRVGRDVRLEPVEETYPLELPNGHSINLGTGLNSDERAIITPILTVTQTFSPGQLLTYLGWTLKWHPTNYPSTKKPDTYPRRNTNLAKNVD